MTPVVPPPRWFFSRHALERQRQMGLERQEIVDALNDPEVRYPSDNRCELALRGRLAVVFSPESRVVLTCLWRGAGGR